MYRVIEVKEVNRLFGGIGTEIDSLQTNLDFC
jgi:hypothetical protein